MSEELLLGTQAAILMLLFVASLAAIAFKRLHFPYTVGLVVVGLGLGWGAQTLPWLEPIRSFSLSHELILFIFLPPLIFESAINLNCRLLARNFSPVIVLATVGLLLSTAIVGGIVGAATPLSWGEALLFGSLISATDPVAVISLFKELGVPQRLLVFVEGESLFNDATAIVTFNIIAGAIAAGSFSAATVGEGLLDFAISFVGGILVGIVLGYLMSYFIAQAPQNQFVLGTATVLVAYSSFIIAERGLHVSGALAIVSSGAIVGWYMSAALSPEVRGFLNELWEYTSFLANSSIFLLVGIATANFIGRQEEFLSFLPMLAVAIVAILIARSTAVFTLIPLLNRFFLSEPLNRSAQIVSVWGGLRGAVGLALALSLESASDVNSEAIVALTLGIALFTLLVSGSTISQVIRALGLDKPSMLEELEEAQALVSAKEEALEQVEFLRSLATISAEAIAPVEREAIAQLQEAKAMLAQAWMDSDREAELRRQLLWLQAIAIEQQCYNQLYEQGVLSVLALDRLMLAISLKRDKILDRKIPPHLPAVLLVDTPFERLLTNLVKKIAVRRQLLHRSRLEARTTAYQYDLALVYVSDRVAEEIESCTKDSPLEMEIVRECCRAYRDEALAARQRLEGTSEHLGQVAVQIQEQIVRQAAMNRQMEAIASLAAQGIISDKVAALVNRQ